MGRRGNKHNFQVLFSIIGQPVDDIGLDLENIMGCDINTLVPDRFSSA